MNLTRQILAALILTFRSQNQHWFISIVNKFVIGFQLSSILVLILNYSKLPPQIPLWYSRPIGVDQLAASVWIFVLPLIGLIIYVTNLLIATYITNQYQIFTQILFITSGLINAAVFFAVIKIIFLVI